MGSEIACEELKILTQRLANINICTILESNPGNGQGFDPTNLDKKIRFIPKLLLDK
jgi:hypothetical protein